MNIPSTAKCPKCEKTLSTIIGGHVIIEMTGGQNWNGVTYSCPFCHILLSVQIDPVVLTNDIINKLE